MFRSSAAGVNALTLTPGDDAILHEDQTPVAAIASGTWNSSGNDGTTISLPQITARPYMVLMNPGDGNLMLDFQYYAEWNTALKQLKLVNNLGARSFAWCVLADF